MWSEVAGKRIAHRMASRRARPFRCEECNLKYVIPARIEFHMRKADVKRLAASYGLYIDEKGLVRRRHAKRKIV